MERLRDISELIGTDDQSADICQTYLDQPLTFANDNSDLFSPSIGPDVLDDIVRKIKECDGDELSGQLRRHLWSIISSNRTLPHKFGCLSLDGCIAARCLTLDFSSTTQQLSCRALA